MNKIGSLGLPRDGIGQPLEAEEPSTQWQEGVDTRRDLLQELGNHAQLLGKPKLPIQPQIMQNFNSTFSTRI